MKSVTNVKGGITDLIVEESKIEFPIGPILWFILRLFCNQCAHESDIFVFKKNTLRLKWRWLLPWCVGVSCAFTTECPAPWESLNGKQGWLVTLNWKCKHKTKEQFITQSSKVNKYKSRKVAGSSAWALKSRRHCLYPFPPLHLAPSGLVVRDIPWFESSIGCLKVTKLFSFTPTYD